jgi:hypothetical protein
MFTVETARREGDTEGKLHDSKAHETRQDKQPRASFYLVSKQDAPEGERLLGYTRSETKTKIKMKTKMKAKRSSVPCFLRVQKSSFRLSRGCIHHSQMHKGMQRSHHRHTARLRLDCPSPSAAVGIPSLAHDLLAPVLMLIAAARATDHSLVRPRAPVQLP